MSEPPRAPKMAVALNATMRRMMKSVVLASTLAVFVYLILWWFITPTISGWAFETLVSEHTKQLGDMAGVYILYTCPIVALSLLGTLHSHLAKKCLTSKPVSSNNDLFWSRASRTWRMLWTRPVSINRVFGVMAVVDFAAIVSTLALVSWLFYAWYAPQVRLIDAVAGITGADKAVVKAAQAGTMLGRVSAVLISLLFLPVTRNSPILRMLGLPFEQAVKYHKWVGYLLLAVLLGHGGAFVGVSAKEHMWHRLISLTTPVNAPGVLVLPGLVALLVAVYMAATSLPAVRRRHFNFFYYSHQLYFVFFAGFVYHVGVKTAGYTMGPIFLFFLDRFMRLWESKHWIQVSRARVSSDGIIELKVPRSPTLMHDALSFMFFKVPGVSHLQWHPISLASSARDGTGEMTIYIKEVRAVHARGSWTSEVAAHVLEAAKTSAEKRCPFSMPIAVEGPYGDGSEYYLDYKTLVLVAGGIGITPFMAIVQDILHRYRITASSGKEVEGHLPKNIVLIWTVRSETELDILRQVSPSLILKDYESGRACRIHVKAYVTKLKTNKMYVDDGLGGATHVIPAPSPDNNLATTNRVRSITGPGNDLWMFWMILITTCATVVMFEAVNVVVPQNSPYFQWIQVSLMFVSMFVGIVVAGSTVLLCWTAHSKSTEKKMIDDQAQTAVALNDNELYGNVDDVECAHPTLYDMAEGFMFSRPDFSREFDQVEKDFGHDGIGVLVSGPESLQSSVAKECQRRSGLRATLKAQIFNYHSVSFSL